MVSLNKLQKIEKECYELLKATSGVMSGANGSLEKENKHIIEAMRKIVIANEIMGKRIICISGLQGAGKSTLMKNFYGLSEDYFNIALGVGEKIPVMICEGKDCTEPETYVICLTKDNNEYSRKKIEVDLEDFKEATKGNDHIPNTMYLELRVPYKHINSESSVFMLLPGYEKRNDYWKTLIDFSVKCSDAAIFVYNESSFSQADNHRLLNKIKEDFGNNIIYAISHSDTSEDDNASLKESCIEIMSIPKEEEDRVVCVGEYMDSERNDQWIEKLKHAINKYCQPTEMVENNCSKYIYEIIANDIRPILANIKDNFDEGETISIHLNNSLYLNAFDDITQEKRKVLKTRINTGLGKATTNSLNRLLKLFNDSKYRKDRKVTLPGNIRRAIFGENTKDIEIINKIVDEAMKDVKDDSTKDYDYKQQVFEELKKCQKEINQEPYTKKLISEENSKKELVVVKSQENKDLLHDVVLFLNDNNDDLSLKYSDPSKTLKVIADLGTNYFVLSTLEVSVNNNTNLSIDDIDIFQSDISGLKEEVTKIDKVVLGVLGITGLDVLADGVLDIVPVIASSLGVTVPAVLMSAGAIMALAKLTEIGVALARDVNRIEMADYYSCSKYIESIQDVILDSYLDAYDTVMKKVRDRIEDKLIAVTGINTKIYNKTVAMNALNKIDKELSDISLEVIESLYDVGSIFE